MLVFPQMTTGVVVTYPLSKRLRLRNPANLLADGSRVVYTSPDSEETAWDLEIRGATASEWRTLEELFAAAKGRWTTFTFLDPAGNLLAESERFDQPVWSNGPMLQIATGLADPFGGTRASGLVNAGQAVQGVAQRLPVPGTFTYCLSVWARSGSATSLRLTASTESAAASQDFAVGGAWQRIGYPIHLDTDAEYITFAAEIGAGGTVDLFGMQVNAQMAPGGYGKTGTKGGVHTARFDMNALVVRAQDEDCFDVTARIVAAEI